MHSTESPGLGEGNHGNPPKRNGQRLKLSRVHEAVEAGPVLIGLAEAQSVLSWSGQPAQRADSLGAEELVHLPEGLDWLDPVPAFAPLGFRSIRVQINDGTKSLKILLDIICLGTSQEYQEKPHEKARTVCPVLAADEHFGTAGQKDEDAIKDTHQQPGVQIAASCTCAIVDAQMLDPAVPHHRRVRRGCQNPADSILGQLVDLARGPNASQPHLPSVREVEGDMHGMPGAGRSCNYYVILIPYTSNIAS